ncbi:MAG: PASTA domain-containing protein [Clostridia bacterium]|nr:PASTA domain-containing protein [Clostridia bacterium]
MKTRSRYRRAMWRIAFFTFAAATLIVTALLSVYLPPIDEGAEDVTVPDLVGSTYTQDDPRLPRDLYEISVEYRTDDTAPAGTILAQSPPANATRRIVKEKNPCRLFLVVSAGIPTISLPDVKGLGAKAAALQLGELGLRVVRESRATDAYSPGQVVETRPAAGTPLHRGDTVTLFESTTKTRRTLTVPDVTGVPITEASALLRRAGMTAREIIYAPSELPRDTVISQFPLGNTLVTRANTAATLTVSDGSLQPPPEQMPHADESDNFSQAAEDELHNETEDEPPELMPRLNEKRE